MGDPTWRYKKTLGPGGREQLKSEIFDSDEMPGEKEGWFDSPAKCVNPVRKPGRPPKVRPDGAR